MRNSFQFRSRQRRIYFITSRRLAAGKLITNRRNVSVTPTLAHEGAEGATGEANVVFY